METRRGGDSTAPSSHIPPSPEPTPDRTPWEAQPYQSICGSGRAESWERGAAGGKGESKERKPAPGYLGVPLRGKHHLRRGRAAEQLQEGAAGRPGSPQTATSRPGLPAQEEASAHPTARGAALPIAVPHQHARLPCAGTRQEPPLAPPPARQGAFVRGESTSRPSVRTAPALQPQEAPLLPLTWVEMLSRLEINVKNRPSVRELFAQFGKRYPRRSPRCEDPRLQTTQPRGGALLQQDRGGRQSAVRRGWMERTRPPFPPV